MEQLEQMESIGRPLIWSRKNPPENGWFYRLYAVCGTGFLLLCIIIIAVCFTDFHIQIIVPSALAVMALLALFFLHFVKQGVQAVFRSCIDCLDQAVAGHMPEPENEDTEKALFCAKLARFIAIKDRAIREASIQKEQIQSLLSNISHQTKIPIANIRLYSQLLKEGKENSEKLIEKLEEQSEKLKFLVETLVNMARLESGAIQCIPRQENVKELLVQVIGDVYEKAQAKDMQVDLECSPELTAAFDKKWMREAIGNLMDNSIKYTPQGGSIRIKVISYYMFAEIAVSDTGTGIGEEEIPKLFGRFYRGKDACTEEGLGLGLYLARQMVVSQRGYIKVSSKKGAGSTFRVFLPLSLSNS